jgi:4Fe-4S ferredoxin
MAVKLVADRDLCHGCGNCVVACPINAKRSTEIAGGKGTSGDIVPTLMVDDGAIRINDVSECSNCATCVKACPVNAIKLEVVK